MKKRITSLILLCSLLAALASCGGSETGIDETTDSGTDTTTAPESTGVFDAYDVRTFDGRTFNIFEFNLNPHLHQNTPEDEQNGDIINDALYERDSRLEDLYKIEIEYTKAVRDITILTNSVLADDCDYDLIFTDMNQNRPSMVTQGVLYDLCDIEQLSLDETWWSPLMYEELRLNDSLYFTAGDITPAVYQTPLCLFLNLKLYEDYGIEEDIYQMVIDGVWTYDELAKITSGLSTDVNNDNVMHANDDFFGIVRQNEKEASDAFCTSADIKLVKLTEDGKLERTPINDAHFTEALEKISKIMTPVTYERNNDVITKTFMEDRALFLQHKLESAAVNLPAMNSDYLILPLPKFDEHQETYITCVSAPVCAFTAIPSTADGDFSGYITEGMARYSHQYIRPLAYDVVYKIKDTRDERSAEILDLLFNTLYLDLSIVYNFGTSHTVLRNIIFNDAPIASSFAAIENVFDAEIEALSEAWQ